MGFQALHWWSGAGSSLGSVPWMFPLEDEVGNESFLHHIPTLHSYQWHKKSSFLHLRALEGQRSLPSCAMRPILSPQDGYHQLVYHCIRGFCHLNTTDCVQRSHTKTSQDSPSEISLDEQFEKSLLPSCLLLLVIPLFFNSHRPARGTTTGVWVQDTDPEMKELWSRKGCWFVRELNHAPCTLVQPVAKTVRKREEKLWGKRELKGYSFLILPV